MFNELLLCVIVLHFATRKGDDQFFFLFFFSLILEMIILTYNEGGLHLIFRLRQISFILA